MRSQVAKLVGVLMAAFPANRVTTETSAVYENLLEDLEYYAANAAIEGLIATAKFMPTIAEIREAALAMSVGARKAGGEAWGDVMRLIARYGARRYDIGWKAPVADPVAERAVDALGWVSLCDSENQVADRARFIELYDQLAIRHRHEQLSSSLPAAAHYRALEAKRMTEVQQRTGESSSSAAMGKLLTIVASAIKESP